MERIDLHIHSAYSDDGQYSPAELVDMAAAAGLTTMAVSDHNTAAACGETIRLGAGRGIEVIPAIEIDCTYEGLIPHVLGYFIDADARSFRELSEDITAQEVAAGAERLELARDRLGLVVDGRRAHAMANNNVITAELIAEIALEDPANADNPILTPYRPGGARSDNPYVNFYWDHCSPGKPACKELVYPSLAAVVAMIREAGGVPVLAHPGVSLKGCEDKFADLVDKGIRGVEAYSSYHSPEVCAHWQGYAEKLGVFVTCGSDFHGKIKPAIRLGGHGGDAAEADALRALRAAAGR